MIVDRLVLLLVVSVTWSKNWKALSVRSKKLKAWGGAEGGGGGGGGRGGREQEEGGMRILIN